MLPQLLTTATIHLTYLNANYKAILRGTCGCERGTSQFPRQRKTQWKEKVGAVHHKANRTSGEVTVLSLCLHNVLGALQQKVTSIQPWTATKGVIQYSRCMPKPNVFFWLKALLYLQGHSDGSLKEHKCSNVWLKYHHRLLNVSI